MPRSKIKRKSIKQKAPKKKIKRWVNSKDYKSIKLNNVDLSDVPKSLHGYLVKELINDKDHETLKLVCRNPDNIPRTTVTLIMNMLINRRNVALAKEIFGNTFNFCVSVQTKLLKKLIKQSDFDTIRNMCGTIASVPSSMHKDLIITLINAKRLDVLESMCGNVQDLHNTERVYIIANLLDSYDLDVLWRMFSHMKHAPICTHRDLVTALINSERWDILKSMCTNVQQLETITRGYIIASLLKASKIGVALSIFPRMELVPKSARKIFAKVLKENKKHYELKAFSGSCTDTAIRKYIDKGTYEKLLDSNITAKNTSHNELGVMFLALVNLGKFDIIEKLSVKINHLCHSAQQGVLFSIISFGCFDFAKKYKDAYLGVDDFGEGKNWMFKICSWKGLPLEDFEKGFKMLLDMGVDPEKICNKGHCPLTVALGHKHYDYAKIMLRVHKFDKINYTLPNGVSVVRMILESGVDALVFELFKHGFNPVKSNDPKLMDTLYNFYTSDPTEDCGIDRLIMVLLDLPGRVQARRFTDLLAGASGFDTGNYVELLRTFIQKEFRYGFKAFMATGNFAVPWMVIESAIDVCSKNAYYINRLLVRSELDPGDYISEMVERCNDTALRLTYKARGKLWDYEVMSMGMTLEEYRGLMKNYKL